VLDGAGVYKGADLSPLYRDFLGKKVSFADLNEIARRVTRKYRKDGYVFSRAIRGEGEVPVSLEDAIKNMSVIDAVFRSAESGKWEIPQV